MPYANKTWSERIYVKLINLHLGSFNSSKISEIIHVSPVFDQKKLSIFVFVFSWLTIMTYFK